MKSNTSTQIDNFRGIYENEVSRSCTTAGDLSGSTAADVMMIKYNLHISYLLSDWTTQTPFGRIHYDVYRVTFSLPAKTVFKKMLTLTRCH